MRIYLPLDPADDLPEAAARGGIALPAGRAAWALTRTAEHDRAGQDPEDLEYDALLDAVHTALEEAATRDRPAQRAVVLAADVEDDDLEESGEDLGAYGVRLRRSATARPVSLHVTELDVRTAREDDTDPALLWFDIGEADAALDYARASR